MHDAGIATLLLALSVILFAAKLGGHFAVKLKQPAVLGELVFGILLGNLTLVGFPFFDVVRESPAVDTLANLGVILLLFNVGLESTVSEMARVGLSSFLVATLGVIAPFFLGYGVSLWMLPGHSVYVHAFIGATLCATSVGITARVFSDLRKIDTDEARIVLGAAAIDDVFGLVILAAVAGIIQAADQGTSFSLQSTGWIVAKAFFFLAGAVTVGYFISKRVFPGISKKMSGDGVLLGLALSICFVFSYVALLVGLAPIVGAFAAGLVLENVHGEKKLSELLAPVLHFLVPVFFVLMGLRVQLSTFSETSTLGLAVMLTAAAIIGKQVCSFGIVGQKVNRWVVGLGMIPRGEVGLIFANMGLTLHIGGERVVDESVFSAIVIMVVVTTLATPPLLVRALMKTPKHV